MPISQNTINTVQSALNRLDAARLMSDAAYLDLMGIEAQARAEGASAVKVDELVTFANVVKSANSALLSANKNLRGKFNTLFIIPGGINLQTGC
jgi:hypothetical protein